MCHSSSVLFSFCVMLSALQGQGEVDARFAAKKGSSAWLVHETTVVAKAEVQGQDVETTERIAYTLHAQIKDVDAAGDYQVEVKIVRVEGRVEMAMGQGDFDFDSATADDAGGASPMAKHLMASAGKTFVAKVGATGKSIELGDGAAAIVNADGTRPSMLQMTSGSLKQLVGDLFGSVPEKRTAGGAKWQRERVEFHGRVPTRQKLELTLTVVEPAAFEIEATGTLDLATDLILGNKELMPKDSAEAVRQLKNSKVTDSKVTSKQQMSREDGFVLQATSSLSFDVETSQSQMGEVTMHMSVNSSLERTTAEAAMPKPKVAPAEAKK